MASSAPKWHLIDMDGGEEYFGQYEGQDVGEDRAAAYSGAWSVGRETPIIQYLHGESNDIAFKARLFAKDSKASIKPDLDRLKELTKPDPDLGRPHVCRLVIGSIINERVVVLSIGGIKYDSLRQDGSARGAVLQLTCRPYTPHDIEFTDPNAPPTSTRYYRAAENETYEHIARFNYFDPSLGDLLRRQNPDKPDLEANDLVVAPEPRELKNVRVEPYSVPLLRTAEFVALRKRMFDLHGAPYFTGIVRGVA